MAQHYPVHDHGREIGWVWRGPIEGSIEEVWFAVSLDGCELGAHPNRDEAHWLIADDWDAGRPRDPRTPRRRWRPIQSGRLGLEPLYLGR